MRKKSNHQEYDGPKFPEESISIFLNIYRNWDMTLDRYHNITPKSRLTHPEFPGISLSTEEFYGNDGFDLLITKIYKQAVAYGKAQAKKSQKPPPR